MKKSLEHSALPTVEEIKLYQERRLSPCRTHEIELLAEENPMLGDALEGYAALPLFAAVPGVTAAVGQQATASSVHSIAGAKGIASIAKSASSLWHLNSWVIGVSVIGVSVAVVATVAIIDNGNDSSDINTTNNPALLSTEKSAETETSLNTAEYAKEANEQKINTDRKTTLAENKVHENGTALMASGPPSASGEEQEEYFELPTSIESNYIGEIENSASIAEESGLKLNNSALVAVGIIRIKKYKVADYTQLRKATWDKFNLEEVGLSANYSDYSNKEAEKTTDVIQIPYLKYIEQCITAYDNEEYKTSITGFLSVLGQYPDDVNAQFYGAMSYFNHDQPVLALALFEKAEKNAISTFREEIQFYKAKCLKMLNRTEESSALFKSIVAKNGFYKAQAQKELND